AASSVIPRCHLCLLSLFFSPLLTPPPPPSTLFPYTTLFRSTWVSTASRWPATSRSGRTIGISSWTARTRIALPSRTPCTSCAMRSEEHTSELQSHLNLVCRLLLEKKKKNNKRQIYYIYL